MKGEEWVKSGGIHKHRVNTMKNKHFGTRKLFEGLFKMELFIALQKE